ARASAKVMPQRWRQWAARLAMTTGLSSLLGAQHSAYMQRMLKMFDDGRLDNALRHAIPLGGDNPSLGQAFGRLGPRDALQLREQRGPATSIGLGDDLEKHLRALYRRTFDQLDRAGRIDEAVFVLAELLNARQEALDYLEKHQRFAQAAELALAWDMPAAQIVRLHALAGDWRVAVLVARRDDAFEAALALLEPRWPEAGLQLRHEWAQSLVARGRWLDAVRVAWKVDTERAAAAEWLQVAEAAGGAPAARALAWRAQCLPDTLSSQSERIAALRDDPALLHERAALAHELLRLPVPVTAAARRLAAATAGALIVDQAEARAPLAVDDKNRFDPKALRRLVELAADPALSADLPTTGWPERARRPLTQHATPLEWTAPEAGLHAIVDAVPLPDGEFLLALGEAGAVRVDAQGRWRARFAAPAQQIVIANDGHGALVLARRERVWRVSRLELARGQVVDLGMHELDAFATRFDGIGWSVATGRRVQVLDTTRGLREALWQVADLPGAVLALDATASQEIWVLRGDSGLAQWIYALPSRRLQSRDPLPDEADHAVARALVAGVGLVEFSAHPTQPGLAQVRSFTQPAQRWVDVPWHGPGTLLCAAGHWLALREPLADDATDITIALVHGQTGRVHARWHWPRDARLKVRAFDDQWLLFDDQGRLAAVDVEDGVPRELSLR
ncbi:MAG: hypothetical protein ABJD97_19650, partial [Betaproteobacteria bacterium]